MDIPALPLQMLSSEVSIRFHCILVLLNFFAMACFAKVADFQAKWAVGPSAFSRFAVVVSVAGIFLSLAVLCIPVKQLAHALAGIRAVVFAAIVTLMYLLTALLTTISAFSQPECNSPGRDLHAQKNGTHFRNGLPTFFAFVFVLWAVAFMAIYVEISKGRPVPTQVEDPPPTGNLPQGQAFSQHPSNATPHTISSDPYPLPKDDINTSPSVEKRLEAGLPRAPSVQRFHCGICLELHAIDEIVRVDLCEHAFCNKCMRSYISSKLKGRSFPIFCPMCLTEKSAQDPSDINVLLARQVGITKEEQKIWSDLEMAAVSVSVCCPGCKQAVFLPRQEYEETNIITCPLSNCTSRWCKTCQYVVPAGGAKHSCDGSAELDDLVQQQGWRRCPGCQTVIQKGEGCYHMKCIAPGCNTHFCYRCGKLIVRSALPDVVKAEVEKHYRRCRLFDGQ